MENKVSLLGWYGGDLKHAGAAWISTGGETEAKRESIPELLKKLAKDLDKKRAKIDELMDALVEAPNPTTRRLLWEQIDAYKDDPEHGSPYEKSLLHFHMTVDTASHIHLLKHRVGFSINGESARYKEYTEDKYYIPQDWPVEERGFLDGICKALFKKYHKMLSGPMELDLPRKRIKESARYVLPYATQVNLDVSCNFRAFVHFQRLRNSEHAQLEIREIAAEMLRLVQTQTNGDFKHSLEAFGFDALPRENANA